MKNWLKEFPDICSSTSIQALDTFCPKTSSKRKIHGKITDKKHPPSDSVNKKSFLVTKERL
jgi:hypothetical protein